MAVKNFYAVQAGRVPGIYGNWAACQRQVDGFPHNCYQGFGTLEEAEAFLEAFSQLPRHVDDDGGDSDSDGDTSIPKRSVRIAPAPARSGISTRSKSNPEGGDKGRRGGQDESDFVRAQAAKGKAPERKRTTRNVSQKKKSDVANGVASLKINIDMPTAA